jgi:hypothetical protein
MKNLWQAYLIEVNTLTKIQSHSLCRFQTKNKTCYLKFEFVHFYTTILLDLKIRKINRSLVLTSEVCS